MLREAERHILKIPDDEAWQGGSIKAAAGFNSI
jgi:hypothetical protein